MKNELKILLASVAAVAFVSSKRKSISGISGYRGSLLTRVWRQMCDQLDEDYYRHYGDVKIGNDRHTVYYDMHPNGVSAWIAPSGEWIMNATNKQMAIITNLNKQLENMRYA